jgi:hypothetical protein
MIQNPTSDNPLSPNRNIVAVVVLAASPAYVAALLGTTRVARR